MMRNPNFVLYLSLVILVSCLALSLLTGCTVPELARACEAVEPARPFIRAGLVTVEPALTVPFLFSSQVSCADVEAVLAAPP